MRTIWLVPVLLCAAYALTDQKFIYTAEDTVTVDADSTL
jgi:hypothetical protein